MKKKIIFPLLVVGMSLFVSLNLAEVGLRLLYAETVPDPARFLEIEQSPNNLVHRRLPVKLDERLGWVPTTEYNGKWNAFDVEQMVILDDLTRSNGNSAPLKSDCNIVAVGDSFTFGDDVSDSQTWPAHLERKTGCRVVNGGVCAYGADQSYMRALDLMEIHNPQIVILSLIWDDVVRAGQNIRQGLPKPYFTYENNKLVFNKIPSRDYKEAQEYIARPKKRPSLLNKSVLWNRLTQAYAPEYWAGVKDNIVVEDPEIPVCHLFQDLDRRTRDKNIKFFVVAQYYDSEVINVDSHMVRLFECLKGTSVTVIDTFPALKRIEPDIYSYFLGKFGHMSAKGNELIADTIAEYLKKERILTNVPAFSRSVGTTKGGANVSAD